MGGSDPDLVVLLSLTILDALTGILKGIKNKNIFSKNMYVGFIIRKPAIYLSIATMAALDRTTLMQDLDFSLRSCMIYGCILMETTSICENLIILGIWIPKPIRDILEARKLTLSGDDKKDENI